MCPSNTIDESVAKIDAMSSLAKHRTLLAAKSEFERSAIRRKILDGSARMTERGCGEFYFVGDFVVYEALRKNDAWFGIYDVKNDKLHHEFYETLPYALLALAAVIGGVKTEGVMYAARVLNL